jgi:hypothetical protein
MGGQKMVTFAYEIFIFLNQAFQHMEYELLVIIYKNS